MGFDIREKAICVHVFDFIVAQVQYHYVHLPVSVCHSLLLLVPHVFFEYLVFERYMTCMFISFIYVIGLYFANVAKMKCL